MTQTDKGNSIPQSPSAQPQDSALTFGAWLRHHATGLKFIAIPGGLIGVVGLIKGIVEILGYTGPHLSDYKFEGWWRYSLLVLPAFQALFAFVALCLIPRPFLNASRCPRATRAASQFHTLWRVLWVSWLALYAGLAVRGAYLLQNPNDSNQWVNSFLNPLNNAQTVCLLLCYWVLARPTVMSDETQARILPWEKPIGLLVIAMAAELILGFLTKNSPEDAKVVESVFGALSGLAAAVALALLVGRLDSKLIDAPTWVIALGFLYAGIQGAYILFPSTQLAALVLMSLALVLKAVIWLFGAWLLMSGKLLFYLDRIRQAHQSVERDWQEFHREIQSAA